MKITGQNPTFTPICITLETQEEVDEMWAIFNHGVVCPSGGDSVFGRAYDKLPDTPAARGRHKKLDDRIRAAYSK